MSLINRVLGDLAARQAPGAEALDGVQLATPVFERPPQISARNVLLLLSLGLTIATAVMWMRWPKPIPIPQPRVPSLAMIEAPVEAPAPAIEAIAAPAPAAATGAPALQLTPTLAAPPPPVAPAPTPKKVATVKAMEPVEPVAEAAPIADRRPVPAEPPAMPVPAVATARALLDRGQPIEALAALGAPSGSWDVEHRALRAAALQRLGRHAEAADAYRGLLETARGTDAAPYWVGLAISLEGLDRRDDARAAYAQGLAGGTLPTALRAFAEQRLQATTPAR